MNKLTFKLLIGSAVAIGAAAFSLGVIHELRAIKKLTTDADSDEVDAQKPTEEPEQEAAEEAPAVETADEEQPTVEEQSVAEKQPVEDGTPE